MKNLVRFLCNFYGITTEIETRAIKLVGSRLIRTQNAFEGPDMAKFVNKQVAKDVFEVLGNQLETTGKFDPTPVAQEVQKRDKTRWTNWANERNAQREKKRNSQTA